MKCAVLYLRVSSDEQKEKGYSIDAQLSLLSKYATDKKDLKITGKFIEIESAKKSGRPIFNEMLEFVKKEKIPNILVEKTDRLYRNFKDYVIIDELMENLNLKIHLVKENEILSTNSPSHQKLIHNIKVVLAKHFIDNLKEETKKGMVERAAKGWFPGLAPEGYKNNKETREIEIDDRKAHFIPKAFERYATGKYSLFSLNEELYQEGFRSKSCKRFSEHGLQTILKNPFYYGWFNWGGQLWKGKHEPLITKELFDKVQEVLADKNTSQWKGKWFAFKGLLKCGYCGCAITTEVIKGRYTYYRCTYGKRKCGQRIYREEKIDAMFADALENFHITEEIVKWAKEALNHSHEIEKKEVDARLSRLRKQYTRNESYLHKIYQDLLESKKGITEEFFRTEFNEKQKE